MPAGAFAVSEPNVRGATARMTIFDLAGRQLATVHGRGGEQLVWEGKDGAGLLVPTGVYLYSLETGARHQEGKFVVIR